MAYSNRNRFNFESSAYDFTEFDDYEETVYAVPKKKSDINFELFEPRRTKTVKKENKENGNKDTVQRRKKSDAHNDGKVKTAKTGVPSSRREAAAASFAKAEINKKILLRRIAICAAAAATITLLIVSQVHSHELTRSIEATQKNLVELQQDYDIMMDKFNMKMSDSAVEKYASERLGMQIADNAQTEYISLGSDEHFEFGTEDRSSWTRS